MTFFFFITILCVSNLLYPTIAQDNPSLRTYIVHVNIVNDKILSDFENHENYYRSFLPQTASSLDQKSRMVHTYRNVVSGFAARLSNEEAEIIENKEGVLSIRPQNVYPLHTTRSPNFLGLYQNLGFWNDSNYGKGVIIGILDTGITPDHPSFSDDGVPPPPAKWKGTCQLNGTTCNNKLIGARNFVTGDSGPPTDQEGHGTHTASTAAGNLVEGANVFGMANGTASGMAPLAHLAMYKVCSKNCAESDILAAMDAAVEDGVDVLSLSLGGLSAPFYADSIAVGAFSAIQSGIFVSCSAGNSGPVNSTLSNEAPWILTVGASTIDRNIRATVNLVNRDYLDGESLFQPKDFPQTLFPLVFPGSNGDENAIWCAEGSLDSIDVKGKVVLCERGGGIARIAKGQTVKDAGGAAMILMNQEIDGESTLADAHVLPATHVGYPNGVLVKQYIKSTSSPVATVLFRGTLTGIHNVYLAPEVASFSSRGPSVASPGILKPDIIGPGVSILAAWPVSVDNVTTTKATFNMISGTSMSCAHLSGIAALLKSAHPTWSSAAIKSAIMTTADQMNIYYSPIVDQNELPADHFAIGAGHVNPSKANDPGLIYDIQPSDYIPYLCGLGYTDDQVGIIVRAVVSCANETSIPEAQLNYPSFSIALGSSAVEYSRVVTNVGDAVSTYTLEIDSPPGVVVSVTTDSLEFSSVNQQLTYKVQFIKSDDVQNTPFVQGSLKWMSDKHVVRSPISVKFS